MKKLAWFAASLARVILSAWAAQRTATLYVPGTTCPARPSTGNRALTRVGGVSKAAVDYEKRQAVVTFGDTETGVKALTRATTTDAGYPSTGNWARK